MHYLTFCKQLYLNLSYSVVKMRRVVFDTLAVILFVIEQL